MDLRELESYRLSDAVKFNDNLNPRLWGSDEHLLPDVREKLMAIADDFREFLGITDLEIKDITISGSNAAYTYTPHSDIDLHLVVDLPKADGDDVYRELFDAKKYQYNDQHDYKIGNYDVELYVQNANEKHHSQGIYSLLNNDWVKVPSRRKPEVDDISVKSKYEDLGKRIEAAIETGDLKRMDAMAQKIKELRQSGLDTTGEFGPENLAFKILRTNGTLQKLRDARKAAKDQEMSLAEQEKNRQKKKSEWGKFGGMWFPGFDYYTSDTAENPEAFDDQVESVQESMSDASPETIIDIFARDCRDFLDIKNPPNIRVKKDPAWSQRNSTFGRYDPETHTIFLSIANRHIIDILRTLAHELTHAKQNELKELPPGSGETGSHWENEANAMAGKLMRYWADKHPELFQSQTQELEETQYVLDRPTPTAQEIMKKHGIDERQLIAQLKKGIAVEMEHTKRPEAALEIAMDHLWELPDYYTKLADMERNLDEGMRDKIAALATAACVAGAPGCATTSDVIRDVQTVGRAAQTFKGMKADDAREELTTALKDYLRRGTGTRESRVNEASGYIPTAAEKDDPRFKMALTQDVRPGETGRQANKLGLQTDAQGHPQLLMKRLENQLQAIKEGLEDPKDNPCWKGYHPVGTKKKKGRTVPNCVPNEDVEETSDYTRRRDREEKIISGEKPARKKQPAQTSDYARRREQEKKADINESEDLFEVKMSPGELKRWAQSEEAQGIRAGFEAEFIFRDVGMEDDDESEPDWDQDERTGSIDDAVEFFQNGDDPIGSRQAARLRDGLWEEYISWRDEKIDDMWNDDPDSRVEEWAEDNVWSDRQDEYREQAAEALGIETSEESSEQSEKIETWARKIFDQDVEEAINERHGNEIYDEAYEYFRDMAAEDSDLDEESWLSDAYRYMSDIANAYDINWPYWSTYRRGGEQSVEDVANSLQRALGGGAEVRASHGYHSTSRKPGRWIIEPDGSLSPDDDTDAGLEVVSPPMPLPEAIQALQTVIDWANGEGDAYTNSSTGLHMGVSVPYKGGDVDYVKLILFMGDEHVLDKFGRASNSYCRSALSKLKTLQQRRRPDLREADTNMMTGAEKTAAAMELMKKNLIELAARYVQDGVGQDKYTSAHIQPGYIEFRSPGGDYLSMADREIGSLEDTMLRFARAMYIASRPDVERKEYAKKLYKLIDAQNDEALKLFLDYSTGQINQEELKKQWARQVLAKEAPPRPETGEKNIYDIINKQTGQAFDSIEADSLSNAMERAILRVAGTENTNIDWGVVKRSTEPAPEEKLSRRAQVAKKIAGRPTIWHVEDTNTGRVLLIAAENTTYAKHEAMRRDPSFEKISREDPDSFLVQPATAAERAQYQEQQRDAKQDSQDLEQTLRPTAASNRMRYNVSWIEIRNGGELQDSLNVDAATAEAAEASVRHALEVSGRIIRPGSIVVTPLGQNGGQTQQQEYQIYNPDTNMPVIAFWAASDEEAYQRIERYRQQHPAISVALRNAPVPGSTEDRAQQRAREAGADRETMEIYNPRTGEVITTAYNATTAEIMARIREIEQERGLGAGLLRVRYPGEGSQQTQQQSQGQQFTGRWRVRNARTGEVVYTFGGVGNNQADANRRAADWVRQTRFDDPVEVVPEMGIYGSGN